MSPFNHSSVQETEVYPMLATWFGQEFLKHFLAGQPVAAILRSLRLELLMHDNPLGLVYKSRAIAQLRLQQVEFDAEYQVAE